jgi:hypothetical protein
MNFMNRTQTSDMNVNRGSIRLGKAARNSRAILLVMVILVSTMKVPAAWAIPFPNEDLGALSNRELLTELETRGLKVKNLASRTLVLDLGSVDTNSSFFSSYIDCRNEVERRGLAIEGELLEMLHREIKLDRGTDSENPHFPITLAGELLSLIERFHTRKTASSLLVILEADQPSAPMSGVREAAIATMEHVTWLTFRRGGDSSLGRRASRDDQPSMEWWDIDEAARRYRRFLDEHGQNEERWLALAIDRAHQNLRNEDPDICYEAGEFLAFELRDTQPEETCRMLADIISRLSMTEKDPTIKERFYNWKLDGRPTAKNGVEWCYLLGEFRGHARPFLSAVVDLPRRNGLEAPYVTFAIGRIGGRDALAELASIIQEARKHEQTALEYLSKLNHDLTDSRGMWLQDQRFAREGFDALAGQTFESDEERLSWFATHGSRPPEEWLRSSLTVHATQMDSGKSPASLPCYPFFFEAYDPFGKQAGAKEHSAVEWVTKHAEHLQYDSIRHALFLPDAARK